MHIINTDNLNLRTDLVIEQDSKQKDQEETFQYGNISVTETIKQKKHYTTISFEDITDKDNFKEVETIFTKELKKYLKPSPKDVFLVIGLGNSLSTPDSLGPKVLDNTLVTRPYFLLGNVDSSYSNVCKFKPSVTGETGLETTVVLKNIIKDSTATKVILIDALKASRIERLNRIIQITDSGINPGSGINNDRGEVSKETMGVDVVAIGVPTVVDVKTIVEDLLKEEVTLKENLIVTPTNIDFLIEKLALLIANGVNSVLHKDFKRQNNY